jgi:hypothetical protein
MRVGLAVVDLIGTGFSSHIPFLAILGGLGVRGRVGLRNKFEIGDDCFTVTCT